MMTPKRPENEVERLNQLYSYDILDTLPDEDYDNITAIASEICGTKISLVTLVDKDRQWFKSRHGMTATETPRDESFCAHAINDKDDVFIVHDARSDHRFAANPLVTGDPRVIFYAGVPLVDDEGFPLGTLCVIDDEPKELSQKQISSLKALSKQVIRLLDLRKKKKKLQKTLSELEARNQRLEEFAYVAAHDIKSPVTNIYTMAGLLQSDHEMAHNLDRESLLNMIQKSANRLKVMIDNLLAFSKADKTVKEDKETITPTELAEGIRELFIIDDKQQIYFHTTSETIYANLTVLNQVLVNLVANALKYNDKEVSVVEVYIDEHENEYIFRVKDNGPGIPKQHQESVFQLFKTATAQDRYGSKGSGMGLSLVKRLIEASGGTITLESEEGQGATFTFSYPK